MVFSVLGGLARVRVTVAYAFIVTCVTMTLVGLSPEMRDRIIRHASTNLHNLSHGRIGTLVGSAFVVDAGPVYVWLPGLVCLLAVAELLWRSRQLIVAFATGHIGATLLVAVGLTVAVQVGWLPGSVSRATDVGMSYGAAGVLGALTAAITSRWRPAWMGWWLAVGVAMAIASRDFTDVGHAVALGLGMVASKRFGHPGQWTPVRLTLLGVGASFGFLVLGSTDLLVATAAGLAGAVIAEALTRRHVTRAPVRNACESLLAHRVRSPGG